MPSRTLESCTDPARKRYVITSFRITQLFLLILIETEVSIDISCIRHFILYSVFHWKKGKNIQNAILLETVDLHVAGVAGMDKCQ